MIYRQVLTIDREIDPTSQFGQRLGALAGGETLIASGTDLALRLASAAPLVLLQGYVRGLAVDTADGAGLAFTRIDEPGDVPDDGIRDDPDCRYRRQLTPPPTDDDLAPLHTPGTVMRVLNAIIGRLCEDDGHITRIVVDLGACTLAADLAADLNAIGRPAA